MSEYVLGKQLAEHKERYRQDTAGIVLVSKKEQQDLWMKAMDGDKEANQALWLQGVRMVNKLVKKFIQLGKILPGDEMDAIQEGNLAIGENLKNWSPNRGAYSTFIWVCIRGALVDFNDKESREGLTGNFDFDEVIHDALDLRTPAQNDGSPKQKTMADMHGIVHDLDVDDVVLLLDYDHLLDDEEKEVLDLLLYEDWTYEEIGEHIGITRQTASKRADRGILKMRRAYNNLV